MRGGDVRSDSLSGYVDLTAQVPLRQPLRVVWKIVDEALAVLSAGFDVIFSPIRRPSIPPEQSLRALLSQAFYTVRSECQLIEQQGYDLLFRWFIGLGIDDPAFLVRRINNREALR